MTPHIPYVTGKQVARVACKAGFELDRQNGSHAIYLRASDRRRVVIPMHAGQTFKPKTLAGIVQDLGLTFEEFKALL